MNYTVKLKIQIVKTFLVSFFEPRRHKEQIDKDKGEIISYSSVCISVNQWLDENFLYFWFNLAIIGFCNR